MVRKGLEQWGDVKTSIDYDNPALAVEDLKKFGEFVRDYVPLVKVIKLPK